MEATCLLLDGLVTNSQKCYIHNECVTVDEELYPFRGRCPNIQYIPSTPAKYGTKFWMLVDAKFNYVSMHQYTLERTKQLIVELFSSLGE